jgi:hypothetical protein
MWGQPPSVVHAAQVYVAAVGPPTGHATLRWRDCSAGNNEGHNQTHAHEGAKQRKL